MHDSSSPLSSSKGASPPPCENGLDEFLPPAIDAAFSPIVDSTVPFFLSSHSLSNSATQSDSDRGKQGTRPPNESSYLDIYPPFSTFPKFSHTANDKHYVKLLLILDEMRAPKKLFRKILDWGQGATNDNFNWNVSHPDRNSFLLRLHNRFQLPKPQTVSIPLESVQGVQQHEKTVDVVYWDFKSQVERILNDRELMRAENIVWNDPNNPYLPYQPSMTVKEMQDGYVFQNAQYRLCDKNPDSKDFVAGLVMYVDKTHTDILGRYTLEPVVLTFSFFNQATRNNHKAWIVLGYISSLNDKSSAENDVTRTAAEKSNQKGINVRNLHRQWDAILQHSGFLQLQPGFKVKMNLCHKPDVRNLIMPLLCVLGDGQSQD